MAAEKGVDILQDRREIAQGTGQRTDQRDMPDVLVEESFGAATGCLYACREPRAVLRIDRRVVAPGDQ